MNPNGCVPFPNEFIYPPPYGPYLPRPLPRPRPYPGPRYPNDIWW